MALVQFECFVRTVGIVRFYVVFLALTHYAIWQVVEFLEAEVLVRLAFHLLVLQRLFQLFELSQLLLISFLHLLVLLLQHLTPLFNFFLSHFQFVRALLDFVLLVLDFRILVAHFALVNSQLNFGQLEQVLDCGPLLRIDLQHSLNYVLQILRVPVRYPTYFTVYYLLGQAEVRARRERRHQRDQLINYAT